jgi:2-iminobutanoate/2-iminopropanoate deaminase
MTRKVLHIEGVKAPGRPYNHIVRVSGDLLFLSTQMSVDLATGTFIDGDVRQQARRSLQNLQFLLEAGGSSLSEVVKIGIFLADLADFDAMNEVYSEFFDSPGEEPARFTLQTGFPDKRIRVEFEAVASVSSVENS